MSSYAEGDLIHYKVLGRHYQGEVMEPQSGPMVRVLNRALGGYDNVPVEQITMHQLAMHRP